MENHNAQLSPSPPPFDEEEECRVCRGPAEEGYPLYSPCKCSGSIGLTHQDCLASWLEVQRLDGRCELCGTKFRFAPCYSEGAPVQLPLHEVFLGLSRAAIARWLPWVMRIALALGMWLLLVPLVTSYAYIGWLHSPATIATRLRRDFLLSDTISGAVIAGIIVVSFLSLMSFADFLRFNIQQGARNRENNEQAADVHVQDGDIDDVVLDIHHIARRQRNVNAVGVMDQRQPIIAENHRFEEDDDREHDNDGLRAGIPVDPHAQRVVLQRRIRAAAALQRRLDAMEDEEVREQEEEIAHMGPIPLQDDEEGIADLFQAMEDLADEDADFAIPQRQNNFEPQFEPMNEPVDQDAFQDDMEMNLALDELLGLRGPFGALIRNILWFMAFVMTYLGVFAFVPRFVGSSVYKRLLTTISWWSNRTKTDMFEIGVLRMVHELNSETERLERTLKLNDIVLILLGYIAMALTIVVIHLLVSIRKRMDAVDAEVVENNRNGAGDGVRIGNGDFHQDNWDNPNNFDARVLNEDAIEIRMTLGQFLSTALDCSNAFVKVGTLLFLKMLLLPLLLGVWLDAATLQAFGHRPSVRILYAGDDIFSSIVVHWVIGITFMLLVTVSVLQLREVLHPGLLAHAIRPQEPQPDLLGNLLNESAVTHTKRMVLSFGIYAVLLMIYIWLPARILVRLGAESYIPIFRPKFWYLITPQLQVPLELLLFHLTMLGFLEKYKNGIGGLQHRWLALVCEPLGLTDYMLPRRIKRFVFVGWKGIFIRGDELEPDMMDDFSESTPSLTETTSCATEAVTREDAKQGGGVDRGRHNYRNIQVDSFWYELAKKEAEAEQFIEAHMNSVPPDMAPRYEPAKARENGKVALEGCREYIRVPLPLSEQDQVDRRRRRPGRNAPAESTKNLISSTLGAYRLRRSVGADGTMIVEFWKECRAELLPRPPEGWDDLGHGGAEVQGRWAWGKEKKSTIEEEVAARNFFVGHGTSVITSTLLISKLVLLILLSWVAIVLLVIVGVSAPLLTGRFALHLLQLPEVYLHDPVAFGIGLTTLSTMLAAGSQHAAVDLRLFAITTRLRSLPRRKVNTVATALFLWFVFIPFILGVVYDILVIRSLDLFAGASSLTATTLLRNWGSGSIFLNLWAFLCIESVFTKKFWASIGNAAFEDDDDDNAGLPDADADTDRNRHVSWQGSKRGRIARFFNALLGAILRGQWDLVDPDVLLVDCVFPLSQMLTMMLCFPVVGCWSILLFLDLTKSQHAVYEISPFLLQGLCIFAIAAQGCAIFADDLVNWFQIAHDAARDDRYLIGEVLLNYSPDDQVQ